MPASSPYDPPGPLTPEHTPDTPWAHWDKWIQHARDLGYDVKVTGRRRPLAAVRDAISDSNTAWWLRVAKARLTRRRTPTSQPVSLREHLTRHHPGIRQAQPYGMYPDGRPTADLDTAHDMQHERFPEYQDHRHEPDGSLAMQEARTWP